MADAVSAPRAAWLLTRLRSRRLMNQLLSTYRFRKKSPARAATARKAKAGWLLSAFMVVAMVGNVANMSHQSLVNIEKVLGSVAVAPKLQRGWLGVQLAAVTPEIAARAGLSSPQGALLTSLFDGPGKRAGLAAGDLVLQIDGKDIKQMVELPAMVSAMPPGRSIVLTVLRNGTSQHLTATVGINPEDAKATLRPLKPAPGNRVPAGVLNGATLEATALFLMVLLITAAGRELTRPEWDLEWLVTLPLPMSTLIGSRLIERTVTNATGFIILAPFLTVLAFFCGYRWSAPLIGIGLTLVLSFAAATLQTLLDTGLRMSLSPPKLRNLQAVLSVAGVLPLLFAIPMAVRDTGFMFDWAAGLPEWVGFLPPGLAVRAIAAADGGTAAPWLAGIIGEVLVVVAIGYALLLWQLRAGVVAAGAREAVGRKPRVAEPQPQPAAARPALPLVQRRELLLLGRDRTFMVQTLLLPSIMVGMQVFVVNSGSNIFTGAIEHPETVAAIAFALASYTLMASAFQTLNAEGQALWILYCVPRPLEFVLRQKAKLWATVATIYAVIVFAVAIAASGRISLPFLGEAAIVLIGVPIFALIATSLGVFACDPLAQEVQRRVRPTYVYLYMTLAFLYVYAVYASTISQRATMMILTTLLAISLWQKARDQFDYLLDPSASPPARVSVADGLIAALMFFVLQALVVVIFRAVESPLPVVTVVWIAFCAAGAVTYGAVRLVYWRSGTTGVPRFLGDAVPRSLLLGAAGGVVAALGGLVYIKVAAAMGLLPPMVHPDGASQIWLAALAIAAAPLFEEFIFRGLIYGGLRRSLGPLTATLASAAIFSIIHPPLSVIPVFVMGICAAVVYERTRMLAAPMLVHAIYNTAVLGFQWNLMQ